MHAVWDVWWELPIPIPISSTYPSPPTHIHIVPKHRSCADGLQCNLHGQMRVRRNSMDPVCVNICILTHQPSAHAPIPTVTQGYIQIPTASRA